MLRRERDWIAVEIKNSPRADADQLRGLRAIQDLAGLRRRVLVYRGARAMVTADGIDVWPADRLLTALAEDGLWP